MRFADKYHNSTPYTRKNLGGNKNFSEQFYDNYIVSIVLHPNKICDVNKQQCAQEGSYHCNKRFLNNKLL